MTFSLITKTGHLRNGQSTLLFRMSDKIREKVIELGAVWEEAEREILDFLDERYKKVKDGIILEDNENPPLTKKMRYFQCDDGTALLRIRLNKYQRLADGDKIKFSVIIADEEPDMIKAFFQFIDKPTRPVKICKVCIKKYKTAAKLYISEAL